MSDWVFPFIHFYVICVDGRTKVRLANLASASFSFISNSGGRGKTSTGNFPRLRSAPPPVEPPGDSRQSSGGGSVRRPPCSTILSRTARFWWFPPDSLEPLWTPRLPDRFSKIRLRTTGYRQRITGECSMCVVFFLVRFFQKFPWVSSFHLQDFLFFR